uniref:EGF-like domain-containing protein n=1 Tax=Rhabditophanes sp. KR3021 TaxID=114890 RepID=A0AC35UAW0_9BILA
MKVGIFLILLGLVAVNADKYFEASFHTKHVQHHHLDGFTNFLDFKDNQQQLVKSSFESVLESNLLDFEIHDIHLSGLDQDSLTTVIFTAQLTVSDDVTRQSIINLIQKDDKFEVTIFTLKETDQKINLKAIKQVTHKFSEDIIPFGSCKNGGVELPNAVCVCKKYFYGQDCSQSACLHSGIQGVGSSFRCSCPNAYMGLHCEALPCLASTQDQFDFTQQSFILVLSLRDSMTSVYGTTLSAIFTQLQTITTQTPNLYANYILTTYHSYNKVVYLNTQTYPDINSFATALGAIVFSSGDYQQPSLTAIYNAISSQTLMKSRSNVYVYGDNVASDSTGYDPSVTSTSMESMVVNSAIDWNLPIYIILTNPNSNYAFDKNADGFNVYSRIAMATGGEFYYFNLDYPSVADFSNRLFPILVQSDVIVFANQYQSLPAGSPLPLHTDVAFGDLYITTYGKMTIQGMTPTDTVGGLINIYKLDNTAAQTLTLISSDVSNYHVYITNKQTTAFLGFTGNTQTDITTTRITQSLPLSPVATVGGTSVYSKLEFSIHSSTDSNVITYSESNGNTRPGCSLNTAFSPLTTPCTPGPITTSLIFSDPTGNVLMRSFAGFCHSPFYPVISNTVNCQNNGTANADGQTCTCLPYFSGDTCQTVVCNNGGVANLFPGDGEGLCSCVVGFFGDHCEKFQCAPDTNALKFDVSHRSFSIVLGGTYTQSQTKNAVASGVNSFLPYFNTMYPNYYTQYVLTTYGNVKGFLGGGNYFANSSVFTDQNSYINAIQSLAFPYTTATDSNPLAGILNTPTNEMATSTSVFDQIQALAIQNEVVINVVITPPNGNLQQCMSPDTQIVYKSIASETGGFVFDLCSLTTYDTNAISNLLTNVLSNHYRIENVALAQLTDCSISTPVSAAFSVTGGKKLIYVNTNQFTRTSIVVTFGGYSQQFNTTTDNIPFLDVFDISTLGSGGIYQFHVEGGVPSTSCSMFIQEQSEMAAFLGFSNAPGNNFNTATPTYGSTEHPVVHLSTALQTPPTVYMYQYSSGVADRYVSKGQSRGSSCSFDYYFNDPYSCDTPNKPIYLNVVVNNTDNYSVQRSVQAYCKGPDPLTCLNGGVYSNGKCVCSYNYKGPQCETPLCYNGGTVVQNECSCTQGYTGTNCMYISCPAFDFLSFHDKNIYRFNGITFVVENVPASKAMNDALMANIENYFTYLQTNGGANEFSLITFDDVDVNYIISTSDSDRFIAKLSQTLTTVPGVQAGTLTRAVDAIDAAVSSVLYKPTTIYLFTSSGSKTPTNIITTSHKVGRTKTEVNVIYVGDENNPSFPKPDSTEYMYLALLAYSSGGRLVTVGASKVPDVVNSLLANAQAENAFIQDQFIMNQGSGSVYFPIERRADYFTITIRGTNINIPEAVRVFSGNGGEIVPSPSGISVFSPNYIAYTFYKNTNFLGYSGIWKVLVTNGGTEVQVQVRASTRVHVNIGFVPDQSQDYVHPQPPFTTGAVPSTYITAQVSNAEYMNQQVFLETIRVYTAQPRQQPITTSYMGLLNYRDPAGCAHQYVTPKIPEVKANIANVFAIQVNGQDELGTSFQRIQFYPFGPTICGNGNSQDPISGFCICGSTMYQGDDCTVPVCQNGGTADISVCNCAVGFYGDFCEKVLTQGGAGTTVGPPLTTTMAASTTIAASTTTVIASTTVATNSFSTTIVAPVVTTTLAPATTTLNGPAVTTTLYPFCVDPLSNTYYIMYSIDNTQLTDSVSSVKKQTDLIQANNQIGFHGNNAEQEEIYSIGSYLYHSQSFYSQDFDYLNMIFTNITSQGVEPSGTLKIKQVILDILSNDNISDQNIYTAAPALVFFINNNIGDAGAAKKIIATLTNLPKNTDHFNSFNTNTFKQNYWYNTDNYVPGGPAFLMMGGNKEATNFWTTHEKVQFTVLGKASGAVLFELEHRYYGSSNATVNLSTKNLKYLSSRQALADGAAFIRSINSNPQFGLSNKTKWVTFGGGYSGALAAWMRQMYPNLVHMAVASSAPLTGVVDFYQGLNVVQQTLANYNPKCGSDVSAGFAALAKLLKTTDGQKQVTAALNLCDDWSKLTPDDIQFFWNDLTQQYFRIAQFGGSNIGQYRSVQTIDNLCAFHLRASTSPYKNVIDAARWIYAIEVGSECLDVSYEEYIAYLNVPQTAQSAIDTRAWIYQSCTEFGFFPTTDNSAANYWGHLIDINWASKECNLLFENTITNTTLANAVKKTNTYYGGADKFRGSRVIFSNGLNDPWHVLGLLTSTNNNNYEVAITKGAHCEDMYEASDSDSTSLVQGRALIAAKVKEWLAID